MIELDAAACYRVLQARDPRFDGRLFVGVRTTGIYCRPVCPARTPKPGNCRFFSAAAGAQQAGFRPCLRCRPERSPGASFHGTSNTVSRAVALIGDGALDVEDATVASLAERLGMGERQLRRLFDEHLGASPLAVAQTRRVLFAKQLIHETRLPMVEVALASGFRSVRRFNDTFQKLYGRPPRELRRLGAGNGEGLSSGTATPTVTLRLSYRKPYDYDAMLAFLAVRAIVGVEEVRGGVYRRTIRLGESVGFLEVTNLPAQSSLGVAISFPDVRRLPSIVARVRRLFDLDADIETINAHLSRDALLTPLVAARPGLRVPGSWDGFEMAVRAVLGQQVTVTAARTLAGRLAEMFGESFTPGADDRAGTGLHRVFPTPGQVAAADLARIGLTPGSRVRTLRAVAEKAVEDPELFTQARSLDEAVARFRTIRGIGEWTAHYIALRALREPDAFPGADVGILRGATADGSERISVGALTERAEAFRPWRAYAAQHLWAHDASRSGEAAERPEREARARKINGKKKEIVRVQTARATGGFRPYAARADARRL